MGDTRTQNARREPAAAVGSEIRWQWSGFHQLSVGDLYAVLALRQRVFIVEQDCAYQDADGRDAEAWHLLGWGNAKGGAPLLAYARVFPPGVRYAEASIGRIATAPEVRGRGYGRLLTREAMRRCAELFPGAAIRLGAQRRLEEFYRELGFVAASEPYLEDGIEHVEMVRIADE